MSTKIVVTLNLEWLKQNQQKFIAAANSNMADDDPDRDTLLDIEFDAELDDWEVGEDSDSRLAYAGYTDRSADAYVHLQSPFSDDMRLKMAEHMIKTLNKAKALLESIK